MFYPCLPLLGIFSLFGCVVLSASDSQASPSGATVAEGATSTRDAPVPAALSALNTTLQDAFSLLKKELELAVSAGWGLTDKEAVGGRRIPRDQGSRGPAQPPTQYTSGPSTEEARRLAQYAHPKISMGQA